MAREEQKIRSEAVRQTILDTAYKMGIEEGFEAVSIRKIINKMKYSTGVVYHHFKDKQEIIDAIEEVETGRLHAAIVEVLDETKGITHNIEAAFHRIMTLAYEEPEKYNLIVLHKYSRRQAGQPKWLDYLSDGLKKGIESGLVREMDTDNAAFAVWSSFLGFNLMISQSKDLTLEKAEELFRAQFGIILQGILKEGVNDE